MANVLIFTPGKEPEYLESVNTPDYCDVPEDKKSVNPETGKVGIAVGKRELLQYAKPNVIINPDLSSVKNVPKRFWKRNGDQVVEMSAQEKKELSDKETAESDALLDKFTSVDAVTLAKALIRSGLVSKEGLKQAVQEVKNG